MSGEKPPITQQPPGYGGGYGQGYDNIQMQPAYSPQVNALPLSTQKFLFFFFFKIRHDTG